MVKIPGRQTNYEEARSRGFAALRNADPEVLALLGADKSEPQGWELNVFDSRYAIDPVRERIVPVGDPSAGEVPIEWQILTLHYLAAREPRGEFTRWLSFADIQEGRGYLPVFTKRVIGRLCATAGRDRDSFMQACQKLGGTDFEWGDAGCLFQIFPRLPVSIAWYGGDEELEPGATFLFPDNIQSFFSVEDMVVLAESVVGRLQRA